MLGVAAILFDADGVIQLAPANLHLRLTEALGRAPHEREACMAEIFAAEAPALTGEAAFEVRLQDALHRLDAKCDVETVLHHWHMIELDEGIMTIVRRLRKGGMYCAVASNQERNRAQHMSEQLGYGVAFDGEFYSCDLGYTKPSPDYFEAVARLAKLDPRRTLFVDDRLENVEAARRCGFVAEQFRLWEEDDAAKALTQLLRRFGLDLPEPRRTGAG
jgi:putative hydrolase of the HAD superfamily